MIAQHARRLFLLALGLSLALHLGLFSSPSAWWGALQPVEAITLPIEAVLYSPPPPPLKTPSPPAPLSPAREGSPPPSRPTAEPSPSIPETAPTPIPESIAPIPAPVIAPTAPPVSPPEALPEPTPPPASQPAPPPARPTQRQLPETLTLDYAVALGEASFTAGKTRFVWTRRGNRYALTSTTEATGLAALFISGRISQSSEGEIDAAGLRPAQYGQQRGEGRQTSAQFDWPKQRLIFSNRDTALYNTTQDLLGFPFHLAMTARPDEPEFDLPVTDGKKLRLYRVRFIGVERLDGHDTWRFQATRFDDGSLVVWLDPAIGGLPRQIRTQDAKGKMMTLRLAQPTS